MVKNRFPRVLKSVFYPGWTHHLSIGSEQSQSTRWICFLFSYLVWNWQMFVKCPHPIHGNSYLHMSSDNLEQTYQVILNLGIQKNAYWISSNLEIFVEWISNLFQTLSETHRNSPCFYTEIPEPSLECSYFQISRHVPKGNGKPVTCLIFWLFTTKNLDNLIWSRFHYWLRNAIF